MIQHTQRDMHEHDLDMNAGKAAWVHSMCKRPSLANPGVPGTASKKSGMLPLPTD